MPTASKAAKRRLPKKGTMREWDRMTELLSLVGTTGFVHDARPVSLILISEPGTGKTELIERFMPNINFSFSSDLTWKGLMPILRSAPRLGITHLVFTEFQKLFMRKLSVAENCLGTLVQAMEEGVYRAGVGGNIDLGGVQVGIIGAITHGTLDKRRDYLGEIGFLSRAFVLPWEPPVNEVAGVVDRVTKGDKSDLAPVHLRQHENPVEIKLPVAVGELIKQYVWQRYRASALRPLMRFRALTQAAALSRWNGKGRPPTATAQDWFYVQSFDDYWKVALVE